MHGVVGSNPTQGSSFPIAVLGIVELFAVALIMGGSLPSVHMCSENYGCRGSVSVFVCLLLNVSLLKYK